MPIHSVDAVLRLLALDEPQSPPHRTGLSACRRVEPCYLVEIASLLLFVLRAEFSASGLSLCSEHSLASPPPATPATHGPAFAGPTLLKSPPAALPLLASPAPVPAASSPCQLVLLKHKHPPIPQSLVPHVSLHHSSPSVSTSPSASAPWSSTLCRTST